MHLSAFYTQVQNLYMGIFLRYANVFIQYLQISRLNFVEYHTIKIPLTIRIYIRQHKRGGVTVCANR